MERGELEVKALVDVARTILTGRRALIPSKISRDVDKFVREAAKLPGVVLVTIAVTGRLWQTLEMSVSIIHPPAEWPDPEWQRTRVVQLLEELHRKVRQRGIKVRQPRVAVSPMRHQTDGILSQCDYALLDRYTPIWGKWESTGIPPSSPVVAKLA